MIFLNIHLFLSWYSFLYSRKMQVLQLFNALKCSFSYIDMTNLRFYDQHTYNFTQSFHSAAHIESFLVEDIGVDDSWSAALSKRKTISVSDLAPVCFSTNIDWTSCGDQFRSRYNNELSGF